MGTLESCLKVVRKPPLTLFVHSYLPDACHRACLVSQDKQSDATSLLYMTKPTLELSSERNATYHGDDRKTPNFVVELIAHDSICLQLRVLLFAARRNALSVIRSARVPS